MAKGPEPITKEHLINTLYHIERWCMFVRTSLTYCSDFSLDPIKVRDDLGYEEGALRYECPRPIDARVSNCPPPPKPDDPDEDEKKDKS
jgi:hypothetical protein